MDELYMRANGTVERAFLAGKDVPFREDGLHAGPAWRICYAGEEYLGSGVKSADGWYRQVFWAVEFFHKVVMKNGRIIVQAGITNHGSQYFWPETAGLVLGIDSYMESFPQWDSKLFPTLLRCETSHFWGYLSSPAGQVLGIACAQPIASWALDYNRHCGSGGHRIHTLRLDLLCAPPLPKRHPAQCYLAPGETRQWDIELFWEEDMDAVKRSAYVITKAPVVCATHWTAEPGQPLVFYIHAAQCPVVQHGNPSCEIAPVVQVGKDIWQSALLSNAPGYTTLTVQTNDKQCEVVLFCRPPWAWYLANAGKQALEKPQKAGTHTESWYGLFSAYLAQKHGLIQDARLEKKFEELFPLTFDRERMVPIILPKRIQNTACMVGLLADRFAANGRIEDLCLAAGLADYLVDKCQTEDGAFRSGETHYTSVIYIAKSILELYIEEQARPEDEWQRRAAKHFAAARRAVDDLVAHLDNIGTEGEHTFEDGMVSCSITQIAMLSLLLPFAERAPYVAAAEQLLAKHRCLERMGAPDARSSGTTTRFWEAQYDILCPASMTTSPHGWSSWKVYGVWYLYLLTGKIAYLRDAMDTLACCAQLLEWPNGNLRWAFVPDPQIKTSLLRPAIDGRGMSKPTDAVLGEEYVDMISGWYQAPKDTPVFGYAGFGIEGIKTDEGGCCDNDVHECFKAVEEIALCYAYVASVDSEHEVYNARLEQHGDELIVFPSSAHVVAVHFKLDIQRQVRVNFGDESVCADTRLGWVCCKDYSPPFS